ncbi:hypothetical protein D3C87_1699660 [compost metagenome]
MLSRMASLTIDGRKALSSQRSWKRLVARIGLTSVALYELTRSMSKKVGWLRSNVSSVTYLASPYRSMLSVSLKVEPTW